MIFFQFHIKNSEIPAPIDSPPRYICWTTFFQFYIWWVYFYYIDIARLNFPFLRIYTDNENNYSYMFGYIIHIHKYLLKKYINFIFHYFFINKIKLIFMQQIIKPFSGVFYSQSNPNLIQSLHWLHESSTSLVYSPNQTQKLFFFQLFSTAQFHIYRYQSQVLTKYFTKLMSFAIGSHYWVSRYV